MHFTPDMTQRLSSHLQRTLDEHAQMKAALQAVRDWLDGHKEASSQQVEHAVRKTLEKVEGGGVVPPLPSSVTIDGQPAAPHVVDPLTGRTS